MPSHLARAATTAVAIVIVAACSAAPVPSVMPVASVDPSVAPSSIATMPTPSASPVSTPTSTPPAARHSNPAIAAGKDHNCVLTQAGEVRCWGSNTSGQLGNGTTAGSRIPVEVSGLRGGVSAIAAGGGHTCALTGGGRVMCWGEFLGAPLHGGQTLNLVPSDVPRLAQGVSAIAAGGGHTCAVTRAGGVMCWGANYSGQLGDGTTQDSDVPVSVAGLAGGVTAIAAGNSHSCALKRDGRVTCWGNDDLGQVGGDKMSSSPPVVVKGLADVTAIAAGYLHSCAITRGGGVKCWGSNYVGELGDGTRVDSSVPVDVAGLSSVVRTISAGRHTCAVTDAGAVKCWGDNSHRQLGSASVASSETLLDVAGLARGVTGIAAGEIHTCALMTDGGVKCWGDNFVGQLGIEPPCDSSVAVDVNFGGPTASRAPAAGPTDRIEHGSGPTDVVLRVDSGPDLGVSDLTGEFFQPGPEFTLYGDGTVIFRNDNVKVPPADGPILRSRPFRIARLDSEQTQSLLRFALGEGGLGAACDRYENRDTDSFGSVTISIRTVGLHKRVEVAGPNPLGPLMERLFDFEPGSGVRTRTWVADRFWGSLLEVAPYLEGRLLPDPEDAGTVPWPWPDIDPADFVGRDEGGYIGQPRRIMSAKEAAVLGLSDHGGLVSRVYLVGPDRETVYSFSLWPMSPDEGS